MSKHSAACCSVPPAVADKYTPKGEYVTINGMKTYVTGPKDSDTAILFFYDIFGFYPQTVQGADILAHSDDTRGYQVYMPNFFGDNPADLAWYPPDNEDKKKKLQGWLGEVAAPPKHLPKVQAIVEDAQKHNPSIKSWGMIGYCWGGKMASLIAGKSTAFKAAVQTSPAMVDPNDAEKVTIPMCMLASKDEPVDGVKAYEEKLKVKKHVETFSDMPHGWMSARADLNDDKAKAEYERGYKVALTFFHDNL